MSNEKQYRLVYDEALTAVDRQASEIAEIRGAAARALGVAALVAGIAGGVRRDFGALEWVALGLLAIAAGLVLVIWWPRDWKFAIGVADAIDGMIEHREVDGVPAEPLTPGGMCRDRALHLEDDWNWNQERMSGLLNAHRAVLLLVSAVVVLLVLSAF